MRCTKCGGQMSMEMDLDGAYQPGCIQCGWHPPPRGTVTRSGSEQGSDPPEPQAEDAGGGGRIMSGKHWLTVCRSCGKQVMVRSLEETCLWCHGPVRPEEEIRRVDMVQEKRLAVDTIREMEDNPVPPRPKGGAGMGTKNMDVSRYYEENKAAILKDLAELGQPAMLKRWKMPHATWSQKRGGLAMRWGIKLTRTAGVRATLAADKERNREEMIRDYRRLTLLEFYKKWGLNSVHWLKLKSEWGVAGKGRGGNHKAVTPSAPPRAERSLESDAKAVYGQALTQKLDKEIQKLGTAGKKSSSGETKAPPAETAVARSEPKAPETETKAADPARPGGTAAAGAGPLPLGMRVLIVPLGRPDDSAGRLPPLPEFDPQWPQDVKLEWLRTYRELAMSTSNGLAGAGK